MTQTSHMWMVRAERGGVLFEQFETEAIVAIGWSEVGDMSALTNRNDFVAAVAKAYPGNTRAQTAASAGQAYRFVREIQVGDRVVTYSPGQRVYLVGRVRSECRYEPERIGDDPNVRDVEWSGRVSRDQLSLAAKNSLGAISTLFLVPPDVAAEIESQLAAAVSGVVAVPPAAADAGAEELDEFYRDNQSRAFELTKDRIGRWIGMICRSW